MSKAKVTQTPGAEVPTEILAEAIVKISDSIEALKNSKLTERAILLLIQDNCKPVGKYPQKNISQSQIRSVLESIGSLKKVYVKQPKK